MYNNLVCKVVYIKAPFFVKGKTIHSVSLKAVARVSGLFVKKIEGWSCCRLCKLEHGKPDLPRVETEGQYLVRGMAAQCRSGCGQSQGGVSHKGGGSF